MTAPQMAVLGESIAAIEARVGDISEKQSIGLVAMQNRQDDHVRAACAAVLTWFWKNHLDEVFRDLFGDDAALATELCTVRRHRAGRDASHVGWHFDANFSGFGPPFLIFWVPLDPVGETAPGLDVCVPVGRFRVQDLAERWQEVPIVEGRKWIDDAGLPGLFGTDQLRCLSLKMAPGDIAVFDQYVLHRTQSLATATRDRTALEFRAFSPVRPFGRHEDFGRGPAATRSGDGSVVMEPLGQLVARSMAKVQG